MDQEDRGNERQPDRIPGDPPPERRGSAVDGVVVLGGAEPGRLEAKHDQEERKTDRDQRSEGRKPVLHGYRSRLGWTETIVPSPRHVARSGRNVIRSPKPTAGREPRIALPSGPRNTPVSPRPSGALPGTPPVGSPPSRPVSSAACPLSASRAASACG